MTKFRIVISTLIVTLGSVAFLGAAAAHADDSSGITNQFYAPTYVAPPPSVPTPTVPTYTPPPPGPPSAPPTTAEGSHFIPSASTSIPTAVKVVTQPQSVPTAALAATGSLAFTGADVTGLVGIAFLLLLVGAALIRRNRHRVPTRL